MLIASHSLGSGLAVRRDWYGIDGCRQNVIGEIISELAIRVEALPASKTGPCSEEVNFSKQVLSGCSFRTEHVEMRAFPARRIAPAVPGAAVAHLTSELRHLRLHHSPAQAGRAHARFEDHSRRTISGYMDMHPPVVESHKVPRRRKSSAVPPPSNGLVHGADHSGKASMPRKTARIIRAVCRDTLSIRERTRRHSSKCSLISSLSQGIRSF